MKVVSERLGHAHIAHTLQTYQHVLPGMQADAAGVAERLANPNPSGKKKGTEPAGKKPVERRGNNRKNAA